MRHQGKVTGWKDDKGFGFIAPNNGGNRAFVHIKSFNNRQRRPTENDIVTYELSMDANGRAQAEHVAFVDERARSTAPAGQGNVSSYFAAAFLVLVAGAALAGKLPVAVLGVYCVASAIAFGAYALDKSAAKNNQWRIQENTLHFFSLLGGWPGAMAAQRLLRHKSRKRSFQITYWITVVLNCGALVWLFSSSGVTMLRTISEAVSA